MTDLANLRQELLKLPGISSVEIVHADQSDGYLRIYLDETVWSDRDKDRFHDLTKAVAVELLANSYFGRDGQWTQVKRSRLL